MFIEIKKRVIRAEDAYGIVGVAVEFQFTPAVGLNPEFPAKGKAVHVIKGESIW